MTQQRFALLIFCAFLFLPITFGIKAQTIDRRKISVVLDSVDEAIAQRERPIKLRHSQIDSHKLAIRNSKTASARIAAIMQVADDYRGFNNDSSMHYLELGKQESGKINADSLAMAFELKIIPLMPLSGFTGPALERLQEVDTTGFSRALRILYHHSAHQLYSYLMPYQGADNRSGDLYRNEILTHLAALMNMFEPGTLPYEMTRAEWLYRNRDTSRALAVASMVLDSISPGSPLYAQLTHMLSRIERAKGNKEAEDYYLAKSALADVQTATLEVKSLQELGRNMYEQGDIDRAYLYLSTALKSALDSRSEMRVIEAGGALAIIEEAHNSQLASQRVRSNTFMWILIITVVILVVVLALLRKEMQKLRSMRRCLEEANHTREAYIGRFLQLCSIYMDKLNQFCKLANRKISAGKVDDLQRMIKSGKFVEEQSAEFFEVFDDAFLHLYPGFVENINKLLKPEEQIVLEEDERMNTDLRILAMMRLGIEDSRRIAELLNYSVNTIYAYRNRLKNRAIERDNFEAQVMSIGI